MEPIQVEVTTEGVYISDALGEIVCWVRDEWLEDADVPAVIANALVLGYEQGGQALRQAINHPVQWEDKQGEYTPSDGDPGDGTSYCPSCDVYGAPCWCGYNDRQED
jgi:hypothetical protein